MVAQARALAAATGREVRAGFLNAQPTLAEVAAAAGDAPLVVLPMFMADGYLARHAVPRALGRPARLLTPFGLLPDLPGLILAQARQTCRDAGMTPARTTLLLVGHGSRRGGGPPREAVVDQADRVAGTGDFAAVEVAFLEEPPEVDAQLQRCAGDIAVVGFFATPGAHASEDVPRLLAGTRRATSGRVAYAGAIGACPGAVGLLIDALAHDAGMPVRA